MYLLGCDTLGQDSVIATTVLDQIDEKVKYFVSKFEEKEKNMLLHDILAFIEEESKLESGENQYREYEKSVISQCEEVVKEKFSR